MLLHVLVIRHTVLDHRTGDEVFEFVLIPLIESSELVVYVYDKVLTDISECVLFLRIYFSCVTVTVQCWGTEQVKERGLELALLACEYEAGMVTALTVVHCVGNHCHEPLGEVRQPFVGVAHDNATCQVGNGFQ